MKNHLHKLHIIFTLFLLGAAPVFAVKHVVHTGNYYFTPNSLNVTVGDTVQWIWDGGSHTTTSGVIPAGASSWDSPITSVVQSFEYKVTKAGVHNYVCTPHAAMGQVGSFTASAPATILSVTPSNQQVSAAAGTVLFNVLSNNTWMASSNVSWCSVTETGDGDGSIAATYGSNPGSSSRVATITITAAGTTPKVVTVSQDGSTVGLDETIQRSFTLSPNPTRGIFRIFSNPADYSSFNVIIMDVSGKTVQASVCEGSASYSFDLSALSKGYYYVRMINDNVSVIKKLILID